MFSDFKMAVCGTCTGQICKNLPLNYKNKHFGHKIPNNKQSKTDIYLR